MLALYTALTKRAAPWLERLLDKRLARGKEHPERINERKGIASKPRPDAPLIWLHAASVGESQSALILINRLIETNPKLHILITTGTQTSSQYLETRLPKRTIHQFIPLDHPDWVARFLDHWNPNAALWIESELWPNMLSAIKERNIPAALINARLSKKSFRLWTLSKRSAHTLLSTFALILAQNKGAHDRLQKLGATHTVLSDNLKYSAHALPHNNDNLKHLAARIGKHPIWLFASTHSGEEDMACRIHQILKNTYPDLLTILVPRHPERGNTIAQLCKLYDLNAINRATNENTHTLPDENTDIYIADTLGELGLFYRLTNIAIIGRSFSDDGGGGHNPIEAAQLNCAILHGPNVQHQQELYDDMQSEGACIMTQDEDTLIKTLQNLLTNEPERRTLQKTAYNFAKQKNTVIETVMDHIDPFIKKATET